jgi:hypothetical protein
LHICSSGALDLYARIDGGHKMRIECHGKLLDAYNHSLHVETREDVLLVKVYDFGDWEVEVFDGAEHWARRQDYCYCIFQELTNTFFQLEMTATCGGRVVHAQIWLRLGLMGSM